MGEEMQQVELSEGCRRITYKMDLMASNGKDCLTSWAAVCVNDTLNEHDYWL